MAELFEDESVSITDTIQNVKDISKFSRRHFRSSLTSRPLKLTTLLFKHYYNNKITNGFDARFKVDAIIKLGGVDYKTGKLRLNAVNQRGQTAHLQGRIFWRRGNAWFTRGRRARRFNVSYLDAFSFGYTSAFARVGLTNGYNKAELLVTNNSTDPEGLNIPYLGPRLSISTLTTATIHLVPRRT